MQKTKTQTDILLENYFLQESINFRYEPFRATQQGKKDPDYLFEKSGKKVLVENKEIEQINFDKLIPNRAQSLDLHAHLDILRRRVDAASKQLKPYKHEVDFCVVLLGKKQGFPIGITELFWALYGNPAIKVPIDTMRGAPIRAEYAYLTASGSLRKNNPETKEMIFVHDYISGAGIITAFNVYDHYESKIMHPIMEEFSKKQIQEYGNLDLNQGQIKEFLDYYKRVWDEKQKLVPEQYRDQNKVCCRIDVIANPLSNTPLPNDIFDATWDTYKLPEVVQQQ